MITTKILCSLIVLTILCGGVKTAPLSPNVLSVLDSPFVISKMGKSNSPPDISYLFVDLKFDGTTLKICEFGSCPFAGWRPTSVIINGQNELIKSPYWLLFWQLLKRQELPFWWVGGEISEAIEGLKQAGGRYALLLERVEKDPFFKDCVKNTSPKPSCIKDCAAIIVFSGQEKRELIQAFKKKYPNVLFVNRWMADIVSLKQFSYPLFKDLNLLSYKPACDVYPKKYDASLSAKIKQDLGKNLFIIKPVNSDRAKGVIMVNEEELDSTLKLIIENGDSLKNATHQSLSYWANDKNQNFVVEAYAQSKTIFVDGKPYDPTMRLVFCLMHEQGKITVQVLGGFWKTPAKSLDQDASLTELHITVPGLHGVPVEPDDMQKAKQLLVHMLQPLYSHLLDAGQLSD